MNRTSVVLAALLLLLMAILSGGAAYRESITVDEVAHIGGGVSYLQKLDLRMNPEHPPLAKILAALPLVLRGVCADYSDLSWDFSGHSFGMMLGEWPWGHSVALRWNDPGSTVWWARVPMLLLTLVLGAFVYRYASQLGGSWGSLLCLTAFVTTPTFLVFGPLVLTDICVTLFALLTLWAFASLWHEPGRRNLIPFGILLGASFLSKFSSGILLFAFLAFRLSLRWMPLDGMPKDATKLREWRRVRGRYTWKGIALAALTVYAVYFVLSWNQPSDALDFLGSGTAPLLIRRILMPPFLYLRGLFLFAVGSSRPTFILGHTYPHGVWFYFPVMFVLKSTLAFLLMLVLAIPVALFARRLPRSKRNEEGLSGRQDAGATIIPEERKYHWRAVWVFLLMFTGFCMLSRLTISIRHFTIPIVLLVLLLAPVPRILQRLSEGGWAPARLAKCAYVALALFAVVTVVRTYPYYFPFLNSLSFGHPAYTLINDSNLDWNQALPDVNRFVRERGISHLLLDEYGFNEPTVYVSQAQFWNCQMPSASDAGRWAVVSASMIEDGHNCLWLMKYPHETLAAGGMYAFQLPAVMPTVGDPGGPPPESAYRQFGGMPMFGSDSRTVFLNCIRDTKQLQPTMDKMKAEFSKQSQKH
jgi:Dolichyl-phosphate-mannose-protein mannosyltransferase